MNKQRVATRQQMQPHSRTACIAVKQMLANKQIHEKHRMHFVALCLFMSKVKNWIAHKTAILSHENCCN